MKKIPYGVSNFKEIVNSNMYYIDKTMYLENFEKKDRNLFFIRPRRFGKSLFLSMMSTYYDINEKENFDRYFKDLYIGKKENKTKKANEYLILNLNFSAVPTEGGKKSLIKNFDQRVLLSISSFFEKYYRYLDTKFFSDKYDTAISALSFLSSKIETLNSIHKTKKLEVMLLIDEYDNFANNLMHGNQNLYEEILHGEGYIRTFFKGIKEGTEKGVFTKVFVTGVTPIMLDDVTSGANMFTNASLDIDLNSMLGFTQNEVDKIIKDFELDKIVDEKKLRETLKIYTNGYKFSPDAINPVYNTDMLLYIVKNLVSNKKYPRDLIDRNVITDYGKIKNLAKNFITEKDMLEIIERREIGPVILKDRFNLETMYKGLDVDKNVKSLLFFLGLLTIKRPKNRDVVLKIPNYTINKIFWEYMENIFKVTLDLGYEELSKAMDQMRLEGNLKNIMKIYQNSLNKLSNRDLKHHTEETSKSVFITLINIDGLYLIQSEKQAKDGYTDLYLKEDVLFEDAFKYRYLIEFKHLKMSNLKRENVSTETKESLIKLNKKYLDKKINQARVQLDNYIKDRNILKDSNLLLKKLVVLTLGRKYVIYEEMK